MIPVHSPQPSSPRFTIGEISVIGNTVVTPNGQIPLKDANFLVKDASLTTSKTPTWAVVVAILIFWFTCFLGLLLLLIKEDVTQGFIDVTVGGPNGPVHVTQIRAVSRQTGGEVQQYVSNIQAASMALRPNL